MTIMCDKITFCTVAIIILCNVCWVRGQPDSAQPIASNNLNIQLRSLSKFDSCQESLAAYSDNSIISTLDLADVLNTVNPDVDTSDLSVCGMLSGEDQDTPILILQFDLTTDQVSGQQTASIGISNIPTDPQSYDPTGVNDCSGTIRGTDCQVFNEVLEISFATSRAVQEYPLIYDDRKVGYTYKQRYCQGYIEEGDVDFVHPHGYFVQTVSQTCSSATTPGQTDLSDDDSHRDVQCFEEMTSTAPVGLERNSNVCPSISEVDSYVSALGITGLQQFYPDVDLTEPTDCTILGCYNQTETSYDAYMIQELGQCGRFKTIQQGRFLMNVNMVIGSETPSSGQGSDTSSSNTTATDTSSTNTTVTVKSTTLDGWVLQTDPTGSVAGGIISARTDNTIANPMDYSIIVCNTDDIDKGYIGLVNDETLVSEGSDFKINTINPWTTSDAADNGVDKCPYPTETCRRNALGLDSSALYYYINQEQSFVTFGDDYNRIQMTGDIYSRKPQAGYANSCQRGVGQGVPGYQQITGSGISVPTPCQIELVRATNLQLINLSGGGNVNADFLDPQFVQGLEDLGLDVDQLFRPTSIGMYDGFNGKVRCWMAGSSLKCDPLYEADLGVTYLVIIPDGVFSGLTTTVAPVEFVDNGLSLDCSGLVDSTSGSLTVSLRNTGTVPTEASVSTNFFVSKDAVQTDTDASTTTQGAQSFISQKSQIVADISNLMNVTALLADDYGTAEVTDNGIITVGLDAGEVKQIQLTFSLQGVTSTEDLLVVLEAYSSAVQTGLNRPVVFDVIDSTCNAEVPFRSGGVFGAGDGEGQVDPPNANGGNGDGNGGGNNYIDDDDNFGGILDSMLGDDRKFGLTINGSRDFFDVVFSWMILISIVATILFFVGTVLVYLGFELAIFVNTRVRS